MRKLNNKGYIESGATMIVVLFIPLFALLGIMIINAIDDENDQKAAVMIVNEYVNIIQNEKEFSENEKINMEYKLQELGYEKVEIDYPMVTESGKNPLKVSLYKYNIRGGIYSSKVIKEDVIIE